MDRSGIDARLAAPDQHLDPSVAAGYDASLGDRADADAIRSTVDLLAALAGDGVAVEFGVGTGRVALPLAAVGVEVRGIDVSEPMLAELRRKPGAERISVTAGDMADTTVCTDASLVYLVFNTIGNLRTQQQQVACFRNAASHLRPGGRFVIETGVPQLDRLATGESTVAVDVSEHHVGIDEYVDRASQLLVSHHWFLEGDRVRTVSGAFRYVWPSELDLMAELAGLTLESRWADWDRRPFTGDARSHVSVWRR